MKNAWLFMLILGFVGFGLTTSVTAEGNKSGQSVYEEIRSDLAAKDVPSGDIEKVQQPVKNMVNHGAKPDQVKKAVVNLADKGVMGDDLGASVRVMSDLVQNGVDLNQASNAVSSAAVTARAEGLKGEEFAERVKAAAKATTSSQQN